jgi:pimeloyl-ACP methyl ester carboxylesterase
MIGLPLPAGVTRQVVPTSRGPVPVLRGEPQPGAAASGRDDLPVPPRACGDPGPATDVVMTSGFFGTKEDFRELLALLARAGLRGWAYDYRGQLDPGPPEHEFTVAGLAGDLRELVHAVTGGRSAHLIGHCLGGFVARAAALAEPGLARSLTLLCCGPSMRERKHRAMLGGLAKLHTNGGTMVLWPLVRKLLADDDTVMREFWRAKLAAMNPRWVTGVAESLAAEPDRTAELIAAGLPALVVRGQRDRRLWSPDVYADLAGRLGADCVVIERASHSPNMEQPGPTAAALLAFWAATPRPEPAAVTG